MKIDKIKIEKGIPIPKKGNSNGITAVLKKMKIGDSILLPVLLKNIYQLGNMLNMKFAVRKCSEGGVRVWRVA